MREATPVCRERRSARKATPEFRAGIVRVIGE